MCRTLTTTRPGAAAEKLCGLSGRNVLFPPIAGLRRSRGQSNWRGWREHRAAARRRVWWRWREIMHVYRALLSTGTRQDRKGIEPCSKTCSRRRITISKGRGEGYTCAIVLGAIFGEGGNDRVLGGVPAEVLVPHVKVADLFDDIQRGWRTGTIFALQVLEKRRVSPQLPSRCNWPARRRSSPRRSRDGDSAGSMDHVRRRPLACRIGAVIGDCGR